MRKFLMTACAICTMACAPSAYAGDDISYFDGDTELQGYWAASSCENNKDAPVVMIVHQWKGLGAYEKSRADMLAEKCYHAFAIDMYGKGVRPDTKEEAGKQATKYKSDPALARRRLHAALDFAKSKAAEDRNIAVMGYCFGGTMALELARSGADIEGAISFHGGLASEAPVSEPGVIKASVQVHNGAADPHVPPEQVHAFMKEMDNAGADWMLVNYADAVHSFTEKEAGNDPSTGVAYNEKADRRSWEATLDFLNEVLK